MTDEIKRMIDLIIEKRSNGNEVLKNTTRQRLQNSSRSPVIWVSNSRWFS